MASSLPEELKDSRGGNGQRDGWKMLLVLNVHSSSSTRSSLAASLPGFQHPQLSTRLQLGQKKEICGGVLQGIGKEFVHLSDAGGDAEVDCAVTDLDHEATEDVRVDLRYESV